MEASQRLFDIIGIFIGFVCIILLLSMVVTSMVQTIQGALRLRARNLQKGIQTIIETLYGKEGHDPKVLALRALHAKSICFFGRIDDRPEISLRRFLGPPVSYMDPKELPKALKMAGLEDAQLRDRAKQITESFNRMWNQLENRFMARIRSVTIVCAILVAGYFQVSTPALLKQLSMDAPRRDPIENADRDLKKPVALPTDAELPEKAPATPQGEFPEVKGKIKEAGGDGEHKDIGGMLAKIDITGWQEEWAFYFEQGTVRWGNVKWGNFIGVLITAVLLTFGAPFWFERLKEALKLKDILSKGIEKEDKKESNKPDQ